MEKMMEMMIWWENAKASLRSEKGQGMVEYGLILALIAVAAVVTLTSVGTSIKAMFTTVASEIK